MDERFLFSLEYERYICEHFGNLKKLRNKLYYKILKWDKKGMKYGDSMAETKRWIIDQIESQSPLVEVIRKKWIQSIDVDLEKRTGKSEWLYLVETCNMLLWFRAEVDDFNIKIIDIVDTNIIKYPSFNCFDV